VVDSNIHTAWMYDCALMMVICKQKVVVGLGLEAGILGRSSLRIIVTRKVLGRLFLFHKFNQKVIEDLVVQSIVKLC